MAKTAILPRPAPMANATAVWTVRARRLVLLTLGYNLAEAALAVWLGVRASSIVLVGFGLDSLIEAIAAVAVLPRLRTTVHQKDEAALERLEERIHRIVGATFLALAVYVTAQAVYTLLGFQVPEESPLGIALAVFSLVVMPLVAWGKLRCADALESRALRAEAKETLACAYLSLTLLLGLGANAAFG